jgi:hypothetical protein
MMRACVRTCVCARAYGIVASCEMNVILKTVGEDVKVLGL